MSKVEYFLRSSRRSLQKKYAVCQNCGGTESEEVSRKYAVTTLRRCTSCKLLFRAPIDPPEEAEAFYQSEYTQDMTTAMPSLADLEKLKAERFIGSDRDYTHYIDMVRALGVEGGRLFDFGCSWGYGSWQFSQAGYQVESYEISRPRRQYGIDNLQVNAYAEFPPPGAGGYDLFFSAHVLEHVPSPARIISQALEMVKPGGLVVTITPNGNQSFRGQYPANWDRLWGEVHPNLLDDVFYRKNFGELPMLLTSVNGPGPLPPKVAALLSNFASDSRSVQAEDGEYELICVIRKPA